MSYLLPHLRSGWAVDQAILAEEVRPCAPGVCLARRVRRADAAAAARRRAAQDRVVVLRFGHDYEETCMQMDEARRRSMPREAARCTALGLGPKRWRCADARARGACARRRWPPSRRR
jgi:hypothetical protein